MKDMRKIPANRVKIVPYTLKQDNLFCSPKWGILKLVYGCSRGVSSLCTNFFFFLILE